MSTDNLTLGKDWKLSGKFNLYSTVCVTFWAKCMAHRLKLAHMWKFGKFTLITFDPLMVQTRNNLHMVQVNKRDKVV